MFSRDLEHGAVSWMVICRAQLPADIPPILLQVTCDLPVLTAFVTLYPDSVSGDVVVMFQAAFFCQVQFSMWTRQIQWYKNTQSRTDSTLGFKIFFIISFYKHCWYMQVWKSWWQIKKRDFTIYVWSLLNRCPWLTDVNVTATLLWGFVKNTSCFSPINFALCCTTLCFLKVLRAARVRFSFLCSYSAQSKHASRCHWWPQKFPCWCAVYIIWIIPWIYHIVPL